MPNPMQRQNDRDGLQEYIHRVDAMRRLVQKGELDPSKPTRHGPGSDEKMILMTLRDEMGLPMNVDGDSRECGYVPLHPSEPIIETPKGAEVTSPVIRRLMISVPRVRNARAA